MDYYIIGNTIETIVQKRPGYWENRRTVPSREITAVYPTSPTVKMFRSEMDALRYANALSKSDKENLVFSNKLRPIFKVKYNGDELELDWQEETFDYEYTQFHHERGNFKTCPTSRSSVTVTVKACLVELDSLTRISGYLKNYGFFEPKGRTDERGQVNYQWQCSLY